MLHYSKFITSDASDLTFTSTAKFVRWSHLQIEWDSFEAKLSSSHPVVDHKPLSFTFLKRSIKLVWFDLSFLFRTSVGTNENLCWKLQYCYTSAHLCVVSYFISYYVITCDWGFLRFPLTWHKETRKQGSLKFCPFVSLLLLHNRIQTYGWERVPGPAKTVGKILSKGSIETPCSQDNCMGESNTNFNLNSPCIEIPPYAHWDKRRICFVLQKSRNHTFKYWTVQNAPC